MRGTTAADLHNIAVERRCGLPEKKDRFAKKSHRRRRACEICITPRDPYQHRARSDRECCGVGILRMKKRINLKRFFLNVIICVRKWRETKSYTKQYFCMYLLLRAILPEARRGELLTPRPPRCSQQHRRGGDASQRRARAAFASLSFPTRWPGGTGSLPWLRCNVRWGPRLS